MNQLKNIKGLRVSASSTFHFVIVKHSLLGDLQQCIETTLQKYFSKYRLAF